jgi:hypothetical protein
MVSDVNAEAWLSQEMADLLEQGPVGLYEFIWGLRGSPYRLSDDEALRLSGDVAQAMVRSGDAEIYRVTWPELDIVEGPYPLAALDDPAAWSVGESGTLMALVPK